MSGKHIDSNELGHSPSDRAYRSVSISINLTAIRANLATARHLSGGSKQFATIKADAYGHGAVAVAHALSPRVSMRQYSEPDELSTEPTESFADGFAVVSLDEALELRKSGIKQPILVLQGPQTQDACFDIKRHDLWPVIHDLEQYAWFRQHADRKSLSAWLKVDTGMGRLGVRPEAARTILNAALQDGVQWRGILTHFACADESSNPFTLQQINSFKTLSDAFDIERSMANSAAVLGWPQSRSDWARPGIMLYGCNPMDNELPAGVTLEPAMTVTAPVISVKQFDKGAGIGYGQTYRCPESMPIGYVAMGYRDGLPRVLDTTATVTINNLRCPIVGRVSMDSVAVDLRQLAQPHLGMSAEFWGGTSSIDELAQAAGTINYELLTSVRGRRRYEI